MLAQRGQEFGYQRMLAHGRQLEAELQELRQSKIRKTDADTTTGVIAALRNLAPTVTDTSPATCRTGMAKITFPPSRGQSINDLVAWIVVVEHGLKGQGVTSDLMVPSVAPLLTDEACYWYLDWKQSLLHDPDWLDFKSTFLIK